MRSSVIILAIITGMIGCIVTPSVFAHDPGFEIKTSKDILKFCEFFHDEYLFVGEKTLVEQHPSFPNLRACVILYNHIAWKSTHLGRDIVLIAEIEKYLGNSIDIKERHIKKSEAMPIWMKNDAKLWVKDEITDRLFVQGIRTMLKEQILKPSSINTNKNCHENEICVIKSDFIKYSYSDIYGKKITEKYTIESVSNNEISVKTEKISRDGKELSNIIIDNQGTIPTNKICCIMNKFIFSTPIKFGDIVTSDLKVIGETPYNFSGKIYQAWIAQNSEKQNTVIIDKNTGIVFSNDHKETGMTNKWSKSTLVETNMLEKNYITNESIIPKWFKTITMWLGDGLISESEYLKAIENLLERGIIRI
jgi:hypothetical protein